MTEAQLFAAALYELRLLLSGQLGTSSAAELPLRVAAHLAHSLHNDALAVLEGRRVDTTLSLERVRAVDRMFGERVAERMLSHTEAPKV